MSFSSSPRTSRPIDRLAAGRLSRRGLVAAGLGGSGAAALGSGRRPARVAAQDAPSGTVTWWHHFTSDSEMAGLERVMAAFAEAYPDIELVAENIPNADFMAKFTTAVIGGNRPDATMVTADRLPDMVAIDGLVPITARLEAWEGQSSYPATLWTGATRDGEVYGIPAFMFVDWMYYRTDWLEEAGIATPPATWEEFQAAAIAMTDPEQGRFGFGLRGGDGGQDIVVAVIESFGGLTYDAAGMPTFDAARAAEAVAFYAGLATEHKAAPPSAANDSYRQIMEAFRTGQTGMVLHHTGSLAEITDALGDAVMTAPRPAGPAARIARVSPLYNGIMKSDNEDAAWAWISFWANPDVEIGFLEDTGYFPPNSVAAEDERVTGNPLYAAAVETIGFGGLPPAFPGYPGWASTSVLPAFQQVLNGQVTPEQAVEQMALGLEEALG